MPPIVNPGWASELEPDLSGPFGRAWRATYAGELAEQPQAQAQITTWIMHVPGSHPFWTWYAMECIHLRAVEGLDKPAHLQFPGAAYELLVLSLHPEHAAPDPRGITEPAHYLMPPDHVLQFPALPGGDDKARKFVELFARAVVGGVLVPDSDHRERWRATLAKTIEHFTTGHPELN